MGERVCSKCKESLPETTEYFNKNKKGKNGFYSICRVCQDILRILYRRKFPRYVYKVTPYKAYIGMIYTYYKIREYDLVKFMDDQKGCCKICGKSLVNPNWSKSHMHIDHNHSTGEVRGLLCGKCNWMIGLAEEDPEIFDKAKEYLKI